MLAGLPLMASPAAAAPSGSPAASRPASRSASSWPALRVGIAAGPGAPQAGRDYSYLVLVRNPATSSAWIVELMVRPPSQVTVVAAGGGGGWCRIGSGPVACIWSVVPGRAVLTISVTVRVGSSVPLGARLTAVAALSYDWGRMTSATSVQTVARPPFPRRRPAPARPPARGRPPATGRPPVPRRPTAPRLTPGPPPASARTAPTPPSAPSRATSKPRSVAAARPRPRPSRYPSPSVILRGFAAKLLVPAPTLPSRGLPLTILMTVVLTPCVLAGVTRFARRR
jgi:hypothetical protein